jgi:hypothetical protein
VCATDDVSVTVLCKRLYLICKIYVAAKYIFSQKCNILVCQNKVAALREALFLLQEQQTEGNGDLNNVYYTCSNFYLLSLISSMTAEKIFTNLFLYIFRKGIFKQDNRRK